MAAGAPDDVLRSLRRYVWLMLGPDSAGKPWTVRLQRTHVADDRRPVAVVEESAPLSSPHARATIQQGDVQKQQPFAVMCYPEIKATAASAAQEARRIRSLLDAGFSRGLVTSADPPVNIGAPYRIPVYDFDGVPIEGAERAGPPEPYMHAALDQAFNVRALQDPLDELRYTVLAALTVSWWAAGRIPPARPTVVDMPDTARLS